jgi:hypothetical protein
VLDEAAYGYMWKYALPPAVIARLMAGPETRFADQATLRAHLDLLGLTALDVTPDPMRSPPRGLYGAAFSHTNSSATRSC